MKRIPKIGITMRLETNTRRFYLGRDYSEAIEALGGTPVHIGLIPKKSFIEAVLADLDGVLLPGSDTDVDPNRFGEEPHPNLKTVIPEKDETDLLVLRTAEKRNIPVLAICYGMQVLNVSRGGTLTQDIETQLEKPIKHNQGEPLERDSHSLLVENEGILSRLITTKNIRVNSHHHQACRRVGKNLRVTARAKDGVIECIEDIRPDRFVVGVQWHPELSWKNSGLAKNIFGEFLRAAKVYSNQRSKKKF